MFITVYATKCTTPLYMLHSAPHDLLYMLQGSSLHCTSTCYTVHHITVLVYATQCTTPLYMLHSTPHDLLYMLHSAPHDLQYMLHSSSHYCICYTVYHITVYATQFITWLYMLHSSSHCCTFYTVHHTTVHSTQFMTRLGPQRRPSGYCHIKNIYSNLVTTVKFKDYISLYGFSLYHETMTCIPGVFYCVEFTICCPNILGSFFFDIINVLYIYLVFIN